MVETITYQLFIADGLSAVFNAKISHRDDHEATEDDWRDFITCRPNYMSQDSDSQPDEQA